MAQKTKRTDVGVQGRRWEADEWISHGKDTEKECFVPFAERSGTGFHVLRGTCDADTYPDDDEKGGVCGNDAAVRRLTDDGTEDYCLRHADEDWITALEGRNHLDDTLVDLRSECEHYVTDGEAGPGFENVSETMTVDASDRGGTQPSVHRCGDRAFLLVTDSQRYGKAVCRTHARPSWYEPLRIPLGDPNDDYADIEGKDGWPDSVDPEDALYVDTQTGEWFEKQPEWFDWATERYSDVIQADHNLVVLDGAGRPVKTVR